MLRQVATMTTLRSTTLRLFERLRDETVALDAEHVVAPSSTEEAAAVLEAASETGIPTRFLGAGTHLGHGYSVDADLVVTSTRLNKITDWRPDDLTVVVEAGVTIEMLEAELADREQTAVLPEAATGATVGGVIAAGASGYRRLRYGPTRDRVLRVEFATGYGKVVMGGSSVVKSSTGYGVPRLMTGSLGSLGMIGSVTLKLWSNPPSSATVEIDDPGAAYIRTYRPLAVLETSEGSFLYLGGTEEQIAAVAGDAAGEFRSGLGWPDVIADPVRMEFRVPARFIGLAIDRSKSLGARRWIAEHGIGRVAIGMEDVDDAAFESARTWAESVDGVLVITSGTEGLEPWGSPPGSIEIQRRIKQAFDPSGICNPGILPGRL
jgi:glycolate oxidase FAD binding subunit